MNLYIEKLQEECPKSKYLTWYVNIISKRLCDTLTKFEYYELHHIWPKCISTSIEKDDIKNLVKLSFREHIICHLLLTKIFCDERKYKMQHACQAFFFKVSDVQRTELAKINSKTLELLKKEFIERQRAKMIGEGNLNFGGKYTNNPAIRNKMRKPKRDSSAMGKYVRTDSILDKISAERKGKGCGKRNSMNSLDNRAKVSLSKIGRKIAINRTTGERKYVFPDNIPTGFELKG